MCCQVGHEYPTFVVIKIKWNKPNNSNNYNDDDDADDNNNNNIIVIIIKTIIPLVCQYVFIIFDKIEKKIRELPLVWIRFNLCSQPFLAHEADRFLGNFCLVGVDVSNSRPISPVESHTSFEKVIKLLIDWPRIWYTCKKLHGALILNHLVRILWQKIWKISHATYFTSSWLMLNISVTLPIHN